MENWYNKNYLKKDRNEISQKRSLLITFHQGGEAYDLELTGWWFPAMSTSPPAGGEFEITRIDLYGKNIIELISDQVYEKITALAEEIIFKEDVNGGS